MLYGASFFETTLHRGRLISISKKPPMQFSNCPIIEELCPTRSLSMAWADDSITYSRFRSRYISQLQLFKETLVPWLNSLDMYEDFTLLSYEYNGCRGHRAIALEWLKNYRADCVVFAAPEKIYG